MKDVFPFLEVVRKRALVMTALNSIHCSTPCERVRGSILLGRSGSHISLFEQVGASTKMSHLNLASDVFMLKKLHRFL